MSADAIMKGFMTLFTVNGSLPSLRSCPPASIHQVRKVCLPEMLFLMFHALMTRDYCSSTLCHYKAATVLFIILIKL